MKTNLRQVVLRPFRDRFDGRIFRWVFIGMMIATAIYVSRQTRLYEAKGTLKIAEIKVWSDEAAVDTAISSGPSVNTLREVLGSQKMLQLVIARLTAEDRYIFLRPYEPVGQDSDDEIKRLILDNRILATNQTTHILEMRYRHPDRHLAARMIELFFSEIQAYEARVRADQAAYVFQQLQLRAEQSGQQVEVCERAVVAYRESRPVLLKGELEKDQKYQALIKKAETDKNLHKMILERLSEVNAADESAPSRWRISQAPITPDEDDYLMAPLVVSAAGGLAIAMITGVLVALLFKRRTIPSNQSEAL